MVASWAELPVYALRRKRYGLFAQCAAGRGLHSFPFQLNLSSSAHRVTQLDS